MKTSRVLFLATSRKTRGGVTAVVKSYENMSFWKKYDVRWIETHVDKGKFLKLLYAIWAFVKYLLSVWKYEIIHIHTSELPSVLRKYPFFKVAKLLGKKVVVHLHIGNQIDDMAHNRYYHNLFTGADAILVLSESIRERVETFFGVKGKVHVVYNPCPQIDDIAYTDEYKNIIFAGTLNKNKGYSVLIKAYSMIASQFPEWRLNIAGNGELAEARRLAKEYQIDNKVNFLGWVRNEKKDDMFRKASLLCLASYAEGFPMAVLDACSYALPIVSTPVGGLPDILRDDENVLFFKPGDVDGLVSQLRRVLSDKDLRYRLSSASLELSKGVFNAKVINRQIDSLYSELLK